MKLTIPNILSFTRLLLIPVFVVVFYLPFSWGPLASAIIFLLAAITDWLDGLIARQLDQMTRFGAFLDPVADKVMVAVALILVTDHYSTWWITIPAAIIIGREIIISALREWMAEIGKRANVAVSWIGKWKTTFQMISLIALIWHDSFWIELLGYITLYIATGLTVWSMVEYLAAAKKDLLADENN